MDTQRLSRNALSAVGQVVVSTVLLFVLYRFLVVRIGVDRVGLWSLVLAVTSVGRIAEFGMSSSVLQAVASSLPSGTQRRAVSAIWMGIGICASLLGLVALLLHPAFAWLLERFVDEPAARQLGKEVIPYTLASLWMGGVAGLFLAALDGCQRIALRSLITVGVNALFVVSAVLLVNAMGFRGLAIAQVLQAGGLLLVSAYAVGRLLPIFRLTELSWDRKQFLGMLGYGSNVQIVTVAQLLFDPAAKAMLSKVGGLTIAGYFDMASRAVTQFRLVVVSAFQALVPAVSDIHARNPDAVKGAYAKSYRLLAFLVPPYFAVVAAGFPLISLIWLGRVDKGFLIIGWLMCVGWAVNSMAVAAYFSYLGLGRLRWNTISHLCIGLGNVLFAVAISYFLGPIGIVAGSMLALGCGSVMLVIVFQQEHGIRFRALVPPESAGLFLACAASAICTAVLTVASLNIYGKPWLAIAPGLLIAGLLGALVVSRPLFGTFLGLIRGGLMKPYV